MGRLLCFTQFLSLFFFHLYFPSLSSNLSSSHLLCQLDQRHALLHFKNSFSISSSASDDNPPYYDAPYPKTDSWGDDSDCCLWEGVTCDFQTGYVIGLHLSSSMLFGTFHSNSSLFLLSHLQFLDLSNNDFNSSTISPQFGGFFNLRYLNLSYSVFEGQVPLEITCLSNLVSLDISVNSLTLEATTFNRLAQNLTKLRHLSLNRVNMTMVETSSFANLSSSLSSLKLSSCNLQGNILEYVQPLNRLLLLDLSWNSDLKIEATTFSRLAQNLTKLRHLSLNEVNMTTVETSSFANLSSSLSSLKLSSCNLQGNILEYVQPLNRLLLLDLSWNSDLTIEATTFSRLAQNLTELRELDMSRVNMSLVEPISLMNLSSFLSSLKLWGCRLRGEFSGNLLQLPNLRVLDLSGNNNLSGCLPRSNWSSSLDTLYVSHTKIAIYLDVELISNLRSVKILGFSGCSFVGSNISLFGDLRQLSQLYLSSNNFSGYIPSAFSNLKHLNDLDLSSNNFSGYIPSAFSNLKHLKLLRLSSNNFSGHIPPWFLNLNQLIGLDLSSNNLNGTIPNSFANLAQLQILSLANNRLVGPIPSQLGRLSSLFALELSNNLLNGTIPFSLFDLPHLEYLDLNRNMLRGYIGHFQYNSCSYINLSNNKLEGAIPSSICKLKQLEILDLSNNSFSSFIPRCLENFSSDLTVLNLGMNSFQGSIPTLFSKDNSLRYVNLHGNQLVGQIPLSITNCKNLEVLDIGNNKIDDTFPAFLESLPELQVLVLRSNRLHGLLKGTATNYSFSKLRILDMSNNSLSGPLPLEYFSGLEAMTTSDESFGYMGIGSYRYSVNVIWKGWGFDLDIQTQFTTIDLSSNKFTGNISWSIGKLQSLKQLNLSHNYLTGNIPLLLGKLRNLESLDLSSNMLSGKIPMELVDLIFLSVFRVSHNRLEGHILLGKQFNTFDTSSYEENSGLCGFPLKKACYEGEMQPVNPYEDDSQSENGFGWKAVLIGYACGFVFGLTMAYQMFRTRKPIWVAKMFEGKTKTYRSRRKNQGTS